MHPINTINRSPQTVNSLASSLASSVGAAEIGCREAEIPARMSSLGYEIGELESAINALGQRLHDGGVLSQAMGKTVDETKVQHDTTGFGASLSQQIAQLYQLRDVVGEIMRRLEL